MKAKTKTNAVNAFFKAVPDARTQNGALTYSTTMNKVLDLFSMGGALRSKGDKAIEKMVLRAFSENPVYTLRCLFYLRDIRQGVGERRFFQIGIKTVLNSLATQKTSEELEKIMSLIPEYGRWDDLYTFFNTPNENVMLGILEKQFLKDRGYFLENKAISLLPKWLCSENTTSKETVENARKIRKFFGISSKEYRKTLSSLRKHLDVTEVKMSSNRWEDINYSAVPSIASKNYNKAFFKHDKERRETFLKAVEKGEKKMNVSVLTPCDLIKYLRSDQQNPDVYNTCDIMFKSLPDFCGEEAALVVADVSGSMCSGANKDLPICASIGMGLYFASKNKGIWKDKVITFSSNPNFVSLDTVKTFQEKYHKILNMEWG